MRGKEAEAGSDTSLFVEPEPPGVLMFNFDGVITGWNRACAALMGLDGRHHAPPRDLTALADAMVAAGIVPRRTARVLVHAAKTDRSDLPPARQLRLRDGRIVEIAVEAAGPDHRVAQFRDMSRARLAQQTAARLAYADPVTGLANRHCFNARLAEALAAGDSEVGLLLLDLDRFKLVNDNLGHPVGDALLGAVARRLRAAVRPGDTVARLGGDEFAIVLTPAPDAPERERLAKRLVDVVGRTYLVDGHTVEIGTSMGCATATGGTIDAARLQRQADIALYEAKREGKGRVKIFHPALERRMTARRKLDQGLRRALPLRQFEVHYQPQFADAGQRLTGFEALVRWRHPERGLVPPSKFVPFAEESGLIREIGEWVLVEACRRAARWTQPLSISVNLSPVQFDDPELVRSIAKALAASGLAPERLVLEITETALMRGGSAIQNALVGIKQLGTRIAMDDFGTGYASLSYLQSYGFDEIKLDASFVQAMVGDTKTAAIVEAVARLGDSLGVATIAEGVETAEQMSRVSANGYGGVQGFLFGRPMPADDLDRFIGRAAPLKVAV